MNEKHIYIYIYIYKYNAFLQKYLTLWCQEQKKML
jgi:hypothetical protein